MLNILLTYTALIPSVRFCALKPLSFLEKENKLKLVHKASNKITSDDLNNCDALVMVRCAENHELNMAQECKKSGRMLIYVLDDDLLNVPKEINCHPYYSATPIQNNIKAIMTLCDVLWTPNPNLKNKYGDFFDRCVLIDEPFIGEIYQKKNNNKQIKIGFAGTATHKAFINEFLGTVLKKLKHIHGDKISIEFFGLKPDFIDEIDGTYIPYSNSYEQYCSKMRELNWDIGLAPLEQSEFASCKYFNKYIEYSSYGIVGVYSDVQPYTFGIKNKINGMLTENSTDEWVSALSSLIENNELVKSISEYAQNELQSRFTIPSVAHKIFNETNFVRCNKTGSIKYKKRPYIMSKLIIYTQIYGLKMPFFVIKKMASKLFKL